MKETESVAPQSPYRPVSESIDSQHFFAIFAAIHDFVSFAPLPEIFVSLVESLPRRPSSVKFLRSLRSFAAIQLQRFASILCAIESTIFRSRTLLLRSGK
jgi:hypothetical protein